MFENFLNKFKSVDTAAVEQKEKEDRLAALYQNRDSIWAFMQNSPHRDDARRLDQLEEQIAQLEDELGLQTQEDGDILPEEEELVNEEIEKLTDEEIEEDIEELESEVEETKITE